MDRESAIANRNAINRREFRESRLGEGGFIDIVDVNERLLVKPAPKNIVINLWNQLLLDIFGIASYSRRLCRRDKQTLVRIRAPKSGVKSNP